MSNQSAVVFDLDGTLIDSAPDLHLAANRLLAEEGQPALTLAQVQTMVGEGVYRLVAHIFAAVDIELSEAGLVRYTDRFRALYLEEPCRLTTIMPGAEACLEVLGNTHALALCTNKPIAHTRVVLRTLGLADRFQSVIGGDSLDVRKPDPAPLLRAIEEVGAGRTASVFIGDSRTDLETGQAAGVDVVLVDGGYTKVPAREMPAQAHAAGLADVPAAVATLMGRAKENGADR